MSEEKIRTERGEEDTTGLLRELSDETLEQISGGVMEVFHKTNQEQAIK